jgi:serine/threonine protein kinase
MNTSDSPKEVDGKYTILECLTKGASTKINLCRDQAGNLYIMKVMKNSSRLLYSNIVQNEIDRYKVLDSPYIAKMIDHNMNGVQREGSAAIKKKAYLIMDYINRGELFDYIILNKKLYTKVARYYFRQLIEILEELDNKGICHRDIKVDNLLLDRDYNLKLIDFEFSTSSKDENGQYITLKNVCGTSNYMAPEFFVRNRIEYRGDHVDIFSVGVVLFIMLTGSFPFKTAESCDRYYKYIYHREFCKFWESKQASQLDDDSKEIIVRMLDPDPKTRITLEEIKVSNFYKGDVPTQKEIANYMNPIWLMVERNKKTTVNN